MLCDGLLQVVFRNQARGVLLDQQIAYDSTCSTCEERACAGRYTREIADERGLSGPQLGQVRPIIAFVHFQVAVIADRNLAPKGRVACDFVVGDVPAVGLSTRLDRAFRPA